MPSLAHKLVRKTAQDMAAALYEEYAKDNTFYRAYPSQAAWVNSMWPKLVQRARSTLAEMLNGPYPEDWKKEISDALIQDYGISKAKVLRPQ